MSQLRPMLQWPRSRRRQVATVLAIVAIFVATAIASSRLLRLVFEDLDLVAYLGLFVACWVGAGGALVPIPGVRPISWAMIVQQGAALDPITVSLTAASAMALGQTSYFLATRRAVSARKSTGETESEATAVDAAPPGPEPPPEPEPPPNPKSRAAMAARARERVTREVRQHGIVTAFLVTVIPSPLTTLATTAAATVGTGYLRWVLPTFAGYLLFSVVLAALGQGLIVWLRTVIA